MVRMEAFTPEKLEEALTNFKRTSEIRGLNRVLCLQVRKEESTVWWVVGYTAARAEGGKQTKLVRGSIP